MAAIDSPDPGAQPDLPRRASSLSSPGLRWSLTAAGLLLASTGLQLGASLERWVVLGGSWARDDTSVEDHLFDYIYPADPWESLGTTAQVFGMSAVLLALGVLAMARAAVRRNGALERVLTGAVAGSFGISGAHAFVSGATGAPTALQPWPLQELLGLIGFAGLVLLAVRWLRTARAVSAACFLLLGATAPGHLVTAFLIAPALSGYQSHDTTPWTETALAVWAAMAGMAMLVAAGTAPRSPGRRSPETLSREPAH